MSQEYLDIKRSGAVRKIEKEESPFLTYGQKKDILDYYEEDNKKIGREFYALGEIEPDVLPPEWVFEVEYDYILVGVSSQDAADAITGWLEMRGIENDKIISAYYKN